MDPPSKEFNAEYPTRFKSSGGRPEVSVLGILNVASMKSVQFGAIDGHSPPGRG
jgi:hypothetical protein